MKHSALLLVIVLVLATIACLSIRLAQRPATASGRAGALEHSSGQDSQQPALATDEANLPGTRAAGNQTPQASASPVAAGTASAEKSERKSDDGARAGQGESWGPSLSSGTVASDSQMLFLCLQLKGQKLELVSQSIVNGSMPLPSDVVPGNGVYHRVLSKSGKVLARGLTSDPRILYWDAPVDGGNGQLTGGVIRQENVDFAVRYPVIEGMDHIEFYDVTNATDISLVQAGGSHCYGSFKLDIPVP